MSDYEDVVEMAWAAGLFEGEGSIGTRKGRSEESPRRLLLQLTSTDEDVLRRFHATLQCGGVYGPYGPYAGQTKCYWYWTVSGLLAHSALAKLLIHLGERRTARAKEVLELVRR